MTLSGCAIPFHTNAMPSLEPLVQTWDVTRWGSNSHDPYAVTLADYRQDNMEYRSFFWWQPLMWTKSFPFALNPLLPEFSHLVPLQRAVMTLTSDCSEVTNRWQSWKLGLYGSEAWASSIYNAMSFFWKTLHPEGIWTHSKWDVKNSQLTHSSKKKPAGYKLKDHGRSWTLW